MTNQTYTLCELELGAPTDGANILLHCNPNMYARAILGVAVCRDLIQVERLDSMPVQIRDIDLYNPCAEGILGLITPQYKLILEYNLSRREWHYTDRSNTHSRYSMDFFSSLISGYTRKKLRDDVQLSNARTSHPEEYRL